MMLSLPVDVSKLSTGLPHRPPMVWIDDVLSFSADGGECRTVLKAGAHYMDSKGLRPSAAIEFIAQAYGYIAVCHHASQGQTLTAKRAFLAAIKDATLLEDPLQAGDEIRVTIDSVRAMGPLTMVQGRVKHGDRLVGEAHLRLFSEI